MFETSLGVAAPAERVWAVLVDVERAPEWTASMTEVRLLGDGPLAVGSRVRIKQPKLPPIVWEVTDLDPGRSFSWRAGGPGFTTIGEHRVTSEGPRRAMATLGIRRTGPLAGVADRLFGKVDRRYVTIEAEGLKRRSEAAT
jgi:uncharacterized membrane protein